MKTKIVLTLAVINGVLIALFFFMKPARLDAQNEEAQVKAAQKPAPAIAVQDAMGFSVDDRIEVLRQKEQRLSEREAQLKELERQIQERIKRLEELQSAIRNDLASYRVVSQERVKHLVKIYSSMKPTAAASLMNNLETDVAVEVFLGMKGDVAGGILSYMDPSKAALITQRLVTYRGSTKASAETEAR
ncbi:MAG TPA: hypothetical protein PLS81_03925 [Deltaproteobacteria bacterium]|nr:hypothetical protein [Deltaproteobacteria bacterium]HOM28590.1 hypothetical protein [Deltaproteobacteria bacterium]HPP80725.1 hypothetical protein [Deltaproteobacteria bacterium]